MTTRTERRVQPALITGCSSGIGQATALALVRSGRPVFASARNLASLSALEAAGCRTLALDVTDERSMTAAVELVESEYDSVGLLVNNAGYGLYGPIEQQPITEVRRLFETNVFGLARLTQLVLPEMRRHQSGRIINVSSMGGRTTLPGGGYYHASKYALEAMSDALRLEVRPFGIDVVVIEPGTVRTPWNDGAISSIASADTDEDDDAYEEFKHAVTTTMLRVATGPIPWFASSPEDIARVIARVANPRHPRTRYLVNPSAIALVKLKEWLPDRVYDRLVRYQFGLSGRRRPR